MSILVTGFEPFGGATSNPSAQLVARLAGDYATAVLPVDFAALEDQVPRLLAETRPSAVVNLGVAASATALTFERVAINLIDALIPDNSGAQPVDRPVVAQGPAAYFATLPVKAMAAATRSAGIAAELSLSAGSYACNALMYLVAHTLDAWEPRPRFGFIHVPLAEVMDLSSQELGLRRALHALEAEEVHYAGGSLD